MQPVAAGNRGRVRARRLLVRHLDLGRHGLAFIAVLTAGLQLAAAAAVAGYAGYDRVWRVAGHFSWPWLLVVPAALALSFAGYYLAYQGVHATSQTRQLPWRHLRALVASSFCGLLAHGGTSLDGAALKAAGVAGEERPVSLVALAALEQGGLAVLGLLGAAAAVAAGLREPPNDLTLPWLIAPIPGFLVATAVARWWTRRTRENRGWRRPVDVFLRSVLLVGDLCLHPRRNGPAFAGIVVFWAADAAALWLALAAFAVRANPAVIAVAFATGTVVSRRGGYLGGAGLLMLILPFALWASGVPLDQAVPGVFVYRVLSVWLPAPFSAAALPTLRELRGGRARRLAATPAPTAAGPRTFVGR